MSVLDSTRRMLQVLVLLQDYPEGIHALAFAQEVKDVPHSTVYSILKRLVAKELVQGHPENRPHKGPKRTLYSLTDVGKQVVAAAPQIKVLLELL